MSEYSWASLPTPPDPVFSPSHSRARTGKGSQTLRGRVVLESLDPDSLGETRHTRTHAEEMLDEGRPSRHAGPLAPGARGPDGGRVSLTEATEQSRRAAAAARARGPSRHREVSASLYPGPSGPAGPPSVPGALLGRRRSRHLCVPERLSRFLQDPQIP